jgi:hypothetical protein
VNGEANEDRPGDTRLRHRGYPMSDISKDLVRYEQAIERKWYDDTSFNTSYRGMGDDYPYVVYDEAGVFEN